MHAAKIACVLLVLVAAIVSASQWHRSGEPVQGAFSDGEAGITPAEAQTVLRALRRGIPPSQRDALADGRVTLVEYRAAMAQAARCLALRLNRGDPAAPFEARILPQRLTPDGFSITYGYELSGTLADRDPQPIDRACQEDHSDRVAAVFHLQRRSDPAYMSRVGARFHGCLDREHLPGNAGEGPRARWRRIVADSSVRAAQEASARRCLADVPSIGDLDL